ncbi:MAG: 5-carboxymethyl-2-hydroxymuconate isomerase [Rhodobacterales bacterium RIFCSPHIGHO2_02_FULL_62_130]|nr:MAG: 5-carboxymethyl-2-hydroxymuconate isomerase [Rhodobacterales bacterium RIFCSPHIGHO2_02_FULL_62_130]OHC56712.1 MAG: 5-carboxymethyl-2-hydroxymuconate isomerase [Rhodobacterales bacterium RIFCSPHIGHO2_12_FULL_62_75]HCZ00785.1 5-carboxymethyl-2-hydroxymuconate isomerase [Rhodobacter sp.]
MPHLTIDYSQNTVSNFDALCVLLHGVLLQSGLFELGAIRVRARACPQYAVADRLPENAFADMILRIGKGRSDAEKQAVGAALMQAAEAHFAPLLARPHFALSLEVQEISAPLSWKTNAIHPRLRQN